MKKYTFIIFLIASTMLFTACHSHSEEDGHLHNEETEHHEENEQATSISLTNEQMKAIKLELGTIEKKELTASLKANGILKVPNQNRANVTALLGGIIKTINVQTGNSISKGQVIATITNNSFITMQEEFLSVSSKTEYAETEYERQKTLKDGNAAALKTFQQADTELKMLKAKKSSLQKQLEQIGINTKSLTPENMQTVINITSPISGSISDLLVNIGSYVEANNPIAEIVDNSQLHLDLYVYEKDLSKLKEGQTIHFTLTNNPGKEYDADVYAISKTFESNTKAVTVHAKVKGDKQGLFDGMSVTALVSLENATVDAVPTNAIVSNEGQDYIFLLSKSDSGKNESTFERIPVRKGTTDVGYSEIAFLKDIPVNSKIVTNGAFFVLAKMTNQGEAHEH